MKKILVVDDEKPISDIIKFNMVKEGYEVVTAFDGREALEMFEAENPDILILDLMLPELDGLEVARTIRKTSNVPIIVLSAKDSEFDKVIGLEIGADDYVTKPFSNRELQARVKAILRRSEFAVDTPENEKGSNELTVGELQILPGAFVAKKHGEELELTHREFELLYHLASHVGQVMTREHLLETVWGYDYFGDVRTVDVTIRRLREKIEDTPSRPEYILTRRGASLPLAAPRCATTCTTCISTYRGVTVGGMGEKSFGNNPMHQNPSPQPSATQNAAAGTAAEQDTGTAHPALPLRKLYGMRWVLAGVTLALMVQTLLAIFYPTSLNYFPIYVSSPIPVSVLYWALQITATVFYLRSRHLGFILGVNILGLLLHGLNLFMFIFVGLLSYSDTIGYYFEGVSAVYIIAYLLGQAVTLIDFTLCIVFIIVIMRVFARRRRQNKVQP